MNIRPSSSVAIVAVGALAFSGCSNLTPGENAGVFGALTGAAVGIPLAAAGVDPAVTIPVTLGAAAVAAATAYVVAKHQADQEQRRIAEARARLYMAKLEKQRDIAYTCREVVRLRTEVPLPGIERMVMEDLRYRGPSDDAELLLQEATGGLGMGALQALRSVERGSVVRQNVPF